MPKVAVRISAMVAAVALGAIAALGALLVLAGLPVQAQSGITSPAAGSTISGDVPVIGTAQIDPFQKYELYFKLEPSGDDAFVYFDGNTSPITNGQLGVWRASGLTPGVYTLRLRVVKADGNYAEYFAPNLNVNQGPPSTPTPATPTITPTSSVPTPTFTPAPSATPVVGAVEQPQLEQPAGNAAPLPAVPVEPGAAPAQALPLTAVQPGDLSAQQGSSVEVAATPTPASASARELGEALSMDRLRQAFTRGMRFSAAILLVAFVVLGGKRLFSWARRRYS